MGRKPLKAAGKVKRDELLVRDRARGFGWLTIATKYGITTRHAQNIYRDREMTVPAPGVDPWTEVQKAIEFREAVIEDLATLATSTSHQGVRLGAINARLRAHEGLLDLKRLYGELPLDLQHIRTEADLLQISQRLLAAFDKHAVTDELRRDVAEIFRRPELHGTTWATPGQVLPASGQSAAGPSASTKAA